MKLDNKGTVTLEEMEQNAIFCNVFSLGLRLEIQLMGVGQTRFKADIVGLERKHYLIVRVALNEPVLPKQILAQHTALICRFVVEAELGRIYAFKSEVLQYITHPYRFIIIQYPKIFQYLSLRADKRNPVNIAVELEVSEHGTLPAVLLDLSAKGSLLKLATDNPLINRGEQVRVKVGQPATAIDAVVKRSTRPDGEVRLGLQFLEVLPSNTFNLLMQQSG